MSDSLRIPSGGVPQIETGKWVGQHLNVKHMLPLPADTPFGNLALKYMRLVERVDHVNLLVLRVFASYESAKAQELGPIMQHLLLAEELVYWLRKTGDELIALTQVIAVRQSTGAYPTRVEPGSIGRMLGEKSPPIWVIPHLGFLRLLNEISNAYKHSFVNSDLMLVGRDEPGVYALQLKWNDLANPPTLHNIRVREVVTRFDAFFQSAREELRGCRLPHIEAATQT
jgi:hypothetical protein